MTQDLRRLDLAPEVPATKEAVTAIQDADCVILGPGSFLTSVMPPLLLPELGKAIARNQTAKVIFVENLSPEYGPAGRMSLEQKLNGVNAPAKGAKLMWYWAITLIQS